MARPENPSEYVRYQAEDDLIVYLSQDLLRRQKPGTRKLRFYIGGYGGYWLLFQEPVNGPTDDGLPDEFGES